MSFDKTPGVSTREVSRLMPYIYGQMDEDETPQSMFAITKVSNIPLLWYRKDVMVVTDKQLMIIQITRRNVYLLFQSHSVGAIYMETGTVVRRMHINHGKDSVDVFDVDNNAVRRVKNLGPTLKDFKIGNSRDLKKHGVTRKRK